MAIDDREIAYDYTDLGELVHAYTVSIHKAQGSEYPAVVIPILVQHYVLLQRNLLYTGVTRGKKLVVLVGTKKAMAITVRNSKTEKRFTRLRERLGGRQPIPWMKWEERGLLPVIVQAPFVKNPRSTNAISLGTTQNYEFQAVEI